MKRIIGLMLLAGFALLPALAPTVWAEGPSPALRLDLALSRKPQVVYPLPDPKVVERDAEEAISAIQARERSEELIRQTLRTPSHRPDLNYDIWSGIQSRNVNNALRRR